MSTSLITKQNLRLGLLHKGWDEGFCQAELVKTTGSWRERKKMSCFGSICLKVLDHGTTYLSSIHVTEHLFYF